jgi:hypothetical protein
MGLFSCRQTQLTSTTPTPVHTPILHCTQSRHQPVQNPYSAPQSTFHAHPPPNLCQPTPPPNLRQTTLLGAFQPHQQNIVPDQDSDPLLESESAKEHNNTPNILGGGIISPWSWDKETHVQTIGTSCFDVAHLACHKYYIGNDGVPMLTQRISSGTAGTPM